MKQRNGNVFFVQIDNNANINYNFIDTFKQNNNCLGAGWNIRMYSK